MNAWLTHRMNLKAKPSSERFSLPIFLNPLDLNPLDRLARSKTAYSVTESGPRTTTSLPLAAGRGDNPLELLDQQRAKH